MLLETGRVETVQEQFAWVACVAQSDCQRCREGKGCGGGLLGRLLGDRLHRVRACHGGLVLQSGDRVELGLSEGALVRGAFKVYGIPLAGFLLLPGLLYLLAGVSNDFALLLAGLAGLSTGLWFARSSARRVGADPRFQPVIIRRLDPECGQRD